MEPKEWTEAIAVAVQSLRDQAQRCRLVADRYGHPRGEPIYALAEELESHAEALKERAAMLATGFGDPAEDAA